MEQTITNRERKLYKNLKPLVDPLGVELIDVELKTHEDKPLIRLVVYREQGVALETCQEISDYLGPLIDLELPDLRSSYDLEVSSPGLKRKLRRRKELEIFQGRPVLVNCFMQVEGKKEWKGQLNGQSSEEILLQVNQQQVALPIASVASLRLYFDAEEALKSGRKK